MKIFKDEEDTPMRQMELPNTIDQLKRDNKILKKANNKNW